ncbi:hypothetical protein [Thermaurantiacus sp.]
MTLSARRLAALLALLPATGAAAEKTRDGRPIPEAVRRACRDDAFRLCPGAVARMDRARVRACLGAKADRLSPLCRSAIRPDPLEP